MYWYRAFLTFAQFSVVGSTIRHPSKLPANVLADEHHVHIQGNKAYIATTIAQDCILGVDSPVHLRGIGKRYHSLDIPRRISRRTRCMAETAAAAT